MNKKFSPVVKQIINQSGQEARRLGHDYIGAEHLLLGIISERDSLPVRVLDALLVDVHELKKRLERAIPRYSAYPPAENLFIGEFQVTTQVQRVLKVTFLEAKMMKCEEIYPEHLMLSLLKHSDTTATRLLNEYDVDYESFKKELEYVRSEQDLAHPNLFNQTPSEGAVSTKRRKIAADSAPDKKGKPKAVPLFWTILAAILRNWPKKTGSTPLLAGKPKLNGSAKFSAAGKRTTQS